MTKQLNHRGTTFPICCGMSQLKSEVGRAQQDLLFKWEQPTRHSEFYAYTIFYSTAYSNATGSRAPWFIQLLLKVNHWITNGSAKMKHDGIHGAMEVIWSQQPWKADWSKKQSAQIMDSRHPHFNTVRQPITIGQSHPLCTYFYGYICSKMDEWVPRQGHTTIVPKRCT